MKKSAADPVDEALRLCAHADEAGLVLRVIGGVAVFIHCERRRHLLAGRVYGDVDVVGRAAEAAGLERLLKSLGYEPNWTFNRLHKAEGRLMFFESVSGRRLDVFLDRFTMCHSLDLGPRLTLDCPTVPLADLLLTKLQVVEITQKDLTDAEALLAEHDIGEGRREHIEGRRIADVCAQDWGWFKTAEINLSRLAACEDAHARLLAGQLLEDIRRVPKGRRWRMRALLGTHVPWYQLPEEV